MDTEAEVTVKEEEAEEEEVISKAMTNQHKSNMLKNDRIHPIKIELINKLCACVVFVNNYTFIKQIVILFKLFVIVSINYIYSFSTQKIFLQTPVFQ